MCRGIYTEEMYRASKKIGIYEIYVTYRSQPFSYNKVVWIDKTYLNLNDQLANDNMFCFFQTTISVYLEFD